VSGLRGCVHVAIPDRIEAGTMLVAAACTGSTLTLSPVIPAHLEATVGGGGGFKIMPLTLKSTRI
jgi:UDP-N-acetylglucosamine enolpyruvyl transferase